MILPVDAGIAVTKILDSVLCLRLKESCNIFQTDLPGPGPGIWIGSF